MQQRPFDSRQPNISAARLNYAQIKEQEQLNRERQRQEEFKQEKHQNLVQRQRSQYGHVASHGYGVNQGRQGQTPIASGDCGDDVEIRVFVRECDPDAQAFSFMESNATTGQQQQAPSQQQSHQGAAKPAVLFGRRASANAEERRGQPAATPGRGEVPAYLLKRKAEMQYEKDTIREELERQKEAAQYPPGHRPVTEEERTAILAKLAQRKKELEMELNRLPMRFDTVAVRNKRQQIEGEMAEVDAAQQKFSVKKQLFVPI